MSDICDGLRAPEVLDRIPGLTYRRLNYWTFDRLDAHTHDGQGRGGLVFCYPLSEVRIAAAVVQLTAYGFELDAAFALARNPHHMRDLARILTEALDAETVT